KDVCAYLSHHNNKDIKSKPPFDNSFKVDEASLNIKVTVEDVDACPRFSGLTISNITVADSPQWLKDKLTAIGVRSINNVVDVTN
ncbi:phenylalanine--tRNA ligase beta subunit-related protein, partial [Vibrio parahaemolyticus]